MTNQIEKKNKLYDIINPEKLKQDILGDKLSDLESKIPQINDKNNNKSDNNFNLDKSYNLILKVQNKLSKLTDNIYTSKKSNNTENKKNDSGYNKENIYNTDSGFVGPEEAAKIKTSANIQRVASAKSVMDMLPNWLQKLVK